MNKCRRLLKGARLFGAHMLFGSQEPGFESYENRHEKLQGDRADSDKAAGGRNHGPMPKRKPGPVVDIGGRGRTLGVFRLQGVSGPVPNTAGRVAAQNYCPTDRPAPSRLVAWSVGLPGIRRNARPVPDCAPTSGRERPADQVLRVLLAAALEPHLAPGRPGPAVHRAVWHHQLPCVPSCG